MELAVARAQLTYSKAAVILIEGDKVERRASHYIVHSIVGSDQAMAIQFGQHHRKGGNCVTRRAPPIDEAGVVAVNCKMLFAANTMDKRDREGRNLQQTFRFKSEVCRWTRRA